MQIQAIQRTNNYNASHKEILATEAQKEASKGPPFVRHTCQLIKESARFLLRDLHLLLRVRLELLVLSEDGVLRLLAHNRERYEAVAEVDLRAAGRKLLLAPAWNAPVLAHGILYVQGKDRLVAVELIPR